MARRTQIFQLMPWANALNLSTDSNVIPAGDLVNCDNVTFLSTGAKTKREGLTYWDSISDVPAVTHRASNGTTRTLTFASNLQPGTVEKLVVGEGIDVTTTATSGNEYDYYRKTAGTVATVSTNTITYEATGSLLELTTATTTCTVKRAYPINNITDFWRFTGSIKTQQVMAATEQPKLFRYDSSGNRFEAAELDGTFTVTIASPAVFTVSSTTNFYVNMPIRFTTTGALPTGLAIDTTYYIYSVDSGTDFKLSSSVDGAVLNTSGAQSGTHSYSTITARVGTATRSNALTFNERLFIFQDRINNTPLMWNGTVLSDVHGDMPDASLGYVHLGRIWTNDKDNPDRLHYSSTGSFSEWQGYGDSGAIDINPGDGDTEGITAIFVFKGSLLVAKASKLYRILGNSPENFQIEAVSDALGAVGQATVAPVDQNDVFYVSSKGVHSLGATANYGDMDASYVSTAIQPAFNDWQASQLANMQACYIGSLNSIAFTVAEESSSERDNLWLYNVETKGWYRWPEIDCQAVGKVKLSSEDILFIGTSDGKLIKSQNGTYIDFGNMAIQYYLKTGSIYPDGNPITLKAFYRLYLFFKPLTTFSFTARVKIDRYPEQAVSFSGQADGDVLGTTFVLGSSILGTDVPFGPYSGNIDGVGHGITLEIEQGGTGEQVDIYGFAIEYASADVAHEMLGEP